MNFKHTLDNPQWVANNAAAIRSMLPHGWTCMCTIKTNVDFLYSSLKPLGINLRTSMDVADLFARLVDANIIEVIASQKGDIHQHGYFRVKPSGEDANVELSITA